MTATLGRDLLNFVAPIVAIFTSTGTTERPFDITILIVLLSTSNLEAKSIFESNYTVVFDIKFIFVFAAELGDFLRTRLSFITVQNPIIVEDQVTFGPILQVLALLLDPALLDDPRLACSTDRIHVAKFSICSLR